MKQNKLFQEYVQLYSDEIYFGALTKDIVPTLDEWFDKNNYPNISEVFKDKEIVGLSEKVKIKNKFIRIPSAIWAQKLDPKPRKTTAACLVQNNQIIIYRAEKIYVTERLDIDSFGTMLHFVVFIHEKRMSAHQKMRSLHNWEESNRQFILRVKQPIPWLRYYFQNLDFHWHFEDSDWNKTPVNAFHICAYPDFFKTPVALF